MSHIKFKVEIKKKDRKGIELKKLADLSSDIFSFLDTFGREISLSINPEHWIATKFKNKSLDFDIEYIDEVDDEVKKRFNKDFEKITKARAIRANGESVVSKKALEKFSRIGKHIDFNETISFGIYENGDGSIVSWNVFDKQQSLELEQNLRGFEMDSVEDIYKYFGGIKGVMHNWYMEKPQDKDKPYIKFRRIPENDLVNCYYDNSMYEVIQSLTKLLGQTIIVSGYVTAQRSTREIIRIDIQNVSLVEEYQAGDLDKFLGCAKGITGSLSTDEYISMGRE